MWKTPVRTIKRNHSQKLIITKEILNGLCERGIVTEEQLPKIEEYFLSCQTAETDIVSQKRDPKDVVDEKDGSNIKRRVENEETVIREE